MTAIHKDQRPFIFDNPRNRGRRQLPLADAPQIERDHLHAVRVVAHQIGQDQVLSQASRIVRTCSGPDKQLLTDGLQPCCFQSRHGGEIAFPGALRLL